MSHTDDTLYPPAADKIGQDSNWLVGVIDEPQMAERAADVLLEAGFTQDDVLLLHGPEALKRAEAKDEQLGPLAWVQKAVASIVADTSEFEDSYTREASMGHSIVNVRADQPDDIERAEAILKAHGGHFIKHFGSWTVTDLR